MSALEGLLSYCFPNAALGVAVALAAAGVLAGCERSELSGFVECVSMDDCPAGQGCDDGQCYAMCSDDTECRANQACEDGLCKPVEDPECERDGGCTTPGECEIADGAVCVAGRCIYARSNAPECRLPGPGYPPAFELTAGGRVTGPTYTLDLQLGHATSQAPSSSGTTTFEGNAAVNR
jgi:hypothetical protein